MIKFFTAIIFFSIQPCAQTLTNLTNTDTISEWKTLFQSNYSIEYPSTWELNKSGQMGTSFILFSPLDSEKDTFKENVNLIIQDLGKEKIDLNTFTEISEGQIKTLVTNSDLIESKRVKNSNYEFHKIIYTGDQGIFQLKFEQYYWVIDSKAYVLTFTSEKEKFATSSKTGEKIMNSFRFK
jgi:hypothetical protein